MPLAVSGQNIALVVARALLLGWLIALPRWAGEAGALIAIAAYVLAGWQRPVVRAGAAGTLASLAWLASRPADRWYFLLVGAVVLLAWTALAARSRIPALLRRGRRDGIAQASFRSGSP